MWLSAQPNYLSSRVDYSSKYSFPEVLKKSFKIKDFSYIWTAGSQIIIMKPLIPTRLSNGHFKISSSLTLRTGGLGVQHRQLETAVYSMHWLLGSFRVNHRCWKQTFAELLHLTQHIPHPCQKLPALAYRNVCLHHSFCTGWVPASWKISHFPSSTDKRNV